MQSRGSHYDLRVSAPGPPHLTGGLSWAGGSCVEGGAWGFYKGLGGSAGLKVPVLSGGFGLKAPMKGWGSLCWAGGLRLRTPTLGSRDPTLNRGVRPWDPHPGLWLSALGPPTTEPGRLAGVGVSQGLCLPPTPAVYRLCRVAAPRSHRAFPRRGGGRAEPPPPGRAPPLRPTPAGATSDRAVFGAGGAQRAGALPLPLSFLGGPHPRRALWCCIFSPPWGGGGQAVSRAGWVGWGVGAGRGPWVLVWLREPPRLISVPWTGPPAPGCVPGGIIVPVPGAWHCPCPRAVSPPPRAELHNRFYTFFTPGAQRPHPARSGAPPQPQQRLF